MFPTRPSSGFEGSFPFAFTTTMHRLYPSLLSPGGVASTMMSSPGASAESRLITILISPILARIVRYSYSSLGQGVQAASEPEANLLGHGGGSSGTQPPVPGDTGTASESEPQNQTNIFFHRLSRDRDLHPSLDTSSLATRRRRQQQLPGILPLLQTTSHSNGWHAPPPPPKFENVKWDEPPRDAYQPEQQSEDSSSSPDTPSPSPSSSLASHSPHPRGPALPSSSSTPTSTKAEPGSPPPPPPVAVSPRTINCPSQSSYQMTAPTHWTVPPFFKRAQLPWEATNRVVVDCEAAASHSPSPTSSSSSSSPSRSSSSSQHSSSPSC